MRLPLKHLRSTDATDKGRSTILSHLGAPSFPPSPFFPKDNPTMAIFLFAQRDCLLGNWPKIAADRRLLCGHGLNFAPPQKYHWLLFPHLLPRLLPDASPSLIRFLLGLGTSPREEKLRLHTVASWERAEHFFFFFHYSRMHCNIVLGEKKFNAIKSACFMWYHVCLSFFLEFDLRERTLSYFDIFWFDIYFVVYSDMLFVDYTHSHMCNIILS